MQAPWDLGGHGVSARAPRLLLYSGVNHQRSRRSNVATNHQTSPPPFPLCTHTANQESDGQTGSLPVNEAVLAHNTRQKKICSATPPIPQPGQNCQRGVP